MANVARPQGLRPKGMANRLNRYVAGGIIYPGDLVKLDSNGHVVVCAAGDASVGASNSYCSASGQDCLVFDDPAQLFYIQASGSVPSAQTDFNQNFNILATAGDAVYKVSRQTLDSASAGTGATLQLKLLDYDPRPNDVLGANADCIVAINNHVLKGGTGTAGV